MDGHLSKGVVSTLNDTEFDVAADGSYELIASPEPHDRNWLRLEPGGGSITTRHYWEWERNVAADPTFHVPLWDRTRGGTGARGPDGRRGDRGGHPPGDPLRARRHDRLPRHPGRGDARVGVERAQQVRQLLVRREQHPRSATLRPTTRTCRRATNSARTTRSSCAGASRAAASRTSSSGTIALQTPPYRYRDVSLNRNQIQYEADGSFVVVIAHRDPGVPNWIDAAGLPTGMVFWRFLLPEEPVPPIEAECVPVASLA